MSSISGIIQALAAPRLRLGTSSSLAGPGRSVMSAAGVGRRSPGASLHSVQRQSAASTNTTSIIAKPVPMQLREPAPKGM